MGKRESESEIGTPQRQQETENKMLVYEDKLSGDELCSDSYPSEETTDGCFMEVEGSWIVKGEVEINTGANPSAEGGDDGGVDSNEAKVVDIIDAFELVEQGEYGKKDLMSYFKGWIGSVMEHIAEDDKADFKKRVQGGVKKL